MVNIIIFILVALIIVYFIFKSRKGIENPQDISHQKDEINIADVFVKTRDATHSGFTGVDSPLNGRLILTSKRLLYTTYDQKKITLNFVPRDIENIELEDNNNIIVRCQGKKFKFIVQEQASIYGNPIVFLSDKKYQSITTIERFLEILKLWHQGKVTPDTLAVSIDEPAMIKDDHEVKPDIKYCYHCGEEIPASTEKCPKCKYHQ